MNAQRTLKAALMATAAALAATPLVGQQERQERPTLAEGAQVYAANCGRCHNPRAGTERTDAEWVPIVAHMRARANLTKREAAAVLVFLQGTNLPEGTRSDAAPTAQHGGQGVVWPAALARVLAPIARAELTAAMGNAGDRGKERER